MAKKKVAKKVTKKKVARKAAPRKPSQKKVKRVAPPKIKESMKKAHCCGSWTISTLRSLLGLLFLFAGVIKLLVLLGGNNPLLAMGIPLFLTWVVMVVEILGGAFLLMNILKAESSVLLGLIIIVALVIQIASPKIWENWVEAILQIIFPHLMYVAGLLVVLFERKTC